MKSLQCCSQSCDSTSCIPGIGTRFLLLIMTVKLSGYANFKHNVLIKSFHKLGGSFLLCSGIRSLQTL